MNKTHRHYGASITQRLCLVCLWFLIATGTRNTAQGLTITSSEFQISGDWTEAWRTLSDRESHSVSDSFNTTGSAPLSTSITSNPYGMNTANGSVDSFSLFMDAYSFASGARPGDVETVSPATHIGMLASATTHFQTEADQLIITLSTFSRWNYRATEQDMQIILRDLTTTTTLLNREHLDGSGYDSFDETYNLDVDPSHEYELILSGWFYAYDAKMGRMNMEVGIEEFSASTPVPDSGTTALLLALSLPALLWARKQLTVTTR